ncbi:MAG: glycosyltransferase [Nocardioidaceae bacterium]
MQDIEIETRQLGRLSALFSQERRDRFEETAVAALRTLTGRIVWNVSATAHGGGVAEMLQTQLAYVRGIGIDTRWCVLDAPPEFFVVTKRIHNLVHGEPGDGGPLGEAQRAVVAETSRSNLAALTTKVRAGDIVLLHDPQTAGLVDGLRSAGCLVVWRCHIGRDTPNELNERAWAFLRPMLADADAFVFSRRVYAPPWVPPGKLRVITPSIDPFSAKNCPVTSTQVEAALVQAGLVDGDATAAELTFARADGSEGRVRRHDGLLLDGPPLGAGSRLVVQVSRWDRLKDMGGVLTGFADVLADLPDDVHLMLVGPEVSGVSDDPEGAAVLVECRALWAGLDASQQRRVHLVCLPMDDVEENAHLVNAIQRRASVVVQKSLVEGFGLTVTEAMWKGRPVVASAVGGILDQIVDGEQGLLLQDPHDLAGLGRALVRLLHDPLLEARLGAAAYDRVHQSFLGDAQLEEYDDLVTMLSSGVGDRQGAERP